MSTVPFTDDATTLFRQAWSLYDTITAENYMFHREIYRDVQEALHRRHASGAYRLLDLGCGNARFMAPCLRTAPPTRYVGVDLSASALEEARSHLRDVPAVTLLQQDMLLAVESLEESFDLVFSSFAVHHLDRHQKERLLAACVQRLTPGGEVLLVDVVRDPGQTREDYLAAYLGFMRTNWTKLTPDEVEEACTHVANYDFPESLADLTHLAGQVGLTAPRCLGHYEHHRVLCFTREATPPPAAD